MKVAQSMAGMVDGPADDRLFRAALDASVDGHTLWSPLLDDEGHIVDVQCFYANPVGASFSGRTVGDLIGSRLVESAEAAGNLQLAEAFMAVVRTGVALRHRAMLKTRADVAVWVDFIVVRLAGGLSISGHDVTAEVRLHDELALANAEFARLASTDSLTDLPNRRAWEDALASHMRQAEQAHTTLLVGLLDLDRFKLYNDTYGHPAGDELLHEVAARWSKTLPSQATLARIGGEEFAVAIPGVAPAVAEQILIEMCALVPGNQTSSAGLTLWDGSESPRSLVGRADAALYAAKRAGRNRVETLLPLR
jgi:diguanylate cyclase (GGDEF)-like protein